MSRSEATQSTLQQRANFQERPSKPTGKVADGLSGKIVVHARDAVGAHLSHRSSITETDFGKGAEEARNYSHVCSWRHGRVIRFSPLASPEKGLGILNPDGLAMLVSVASPIERREVARSIRESCNAAGNGE